MAYAKGARDERRIQVQRRFQRHVSQVPVRHRRPCRADDEHRGAAASRLNAEQLQELRTAITTLADDVRARAPQDRREEALEQVQELADATIAADEVDVPRLKRVTRWFAKNAPELAEAVTGLLFGPAVAALVGKAGGLASALLVGDDDEADARP